MLRNSWLKLKLRSLARTVIIKKLIDLNKVTICYDSLIGLVIASTTAEYEVLDSIPGFIKISYMDFFQNCAR